MKMNEEKRMYSITETSRWHRTSYKVMMTEAEVKAYVKMRREMHGYVRGVGGDRTYDCFAVWAY